LGLEDADFALGAAALRGFGGVFAVAMLVLPASFLPSRQLADAHGLLFVAIIA
jgi:hypothetical protein